MTDDWAHACVLCAAHGRQTRLQWGHCCAPCADRIASDLRAVLALAAMASAAIEPGRGTGGSLSIAYGSKPPIRVEAVDPALTHVPGHDAPLLVLLEEWERMARDMRGMARYGVASSERATSTDTAATLTHVVGFLTHHNEWAVTEPEWPLEDYASEVRECVRALRRWDTDRQDVGTMVRCPTVDDDGRECGYRLYYDDLHEDVACRRCGAVRSAMTLAAVAMADGREVWLDPEAAAKHLGVSESTLLRLARKGGIRRSHGRYCVSHMTPVA